MKTIVITGATSFIGLHLIKHLNSWNYKIFAVVRPDSPKIESISKAENVLIVPCAMGDYQNLDQYIQENCDSLIHLAWNGTRGNDRMDYEMQFESYRYGMEAVKAALRLNCNTIISAGSQAEYGIWSGPITEDVVCRPNTEYGKAKLKFYEDTLKLCCENQVHFKEPRFFSLYGPGDYEGSMIISSLGKMLRNQDCELTECKQMWNFLYIDDAIKGLVKLLETDCSDGAYNFGSNVSQSLKSYVEEMYHITKSNSKLQYGRVPYPKTGMVELRPVIDKLRKETGWKEATSFHEGITALLSLWEGFRVYRSEHQ